MEKQVSSLQTRRTLWDGDLHPSRLGDPRNRSTNFKFRSDNICRLPSAATGLIPVAHFTAMGDSESLAELLRSLENACNSIDVIPAPVFAKRRILEQDSLPRWTSPETCVLML
jgi:hypothetical protein